MAVYRFEHVEQMILEGRHFVVGTGQGDEQDVILEVSDGGMSQKDVATALGISRSRVQQIEERALRKLAEGIGESYSPPAPRGDGRAKHR